MARALFEPLADLRWEPVGPALGREILTLAPDVVHLCPSGDARLDAVAVAVAEDLVLEPPDEVGDLGPGAEGAAGVVDDPLEARGGGRLFGEGLLATGGVVVASDHADAVVIIDSQGDILGHRRSPVQPFSAPEGQDPESHHGFLQASLPRPAGETASSHAISGAPEAGGGTLPSPGLAPCLLPTSL
jgi:hypothetical protein